MTYLYETPAWPALHWDSAALARPLAAARHAQGRLLGRLEQLGFPLGDEARLELSTAELLGSWAIEGESLPRDEVRSSIATQLGLDVGGLPRAGRDVDGVVEMMLDATRGHAEPLTEDRLLRWHAALFPGDRSGLRRVFGGAYRRGLSGPMQVVSGPIGRERVHFEAPHADRVPEEVRSFLEWFEEDSDLDPILKAGAGHLRFLTIHPFEDVNGRIARAVLDMALARADGTSQRYASTSARIERERTDYYEQLEAAQRGTTDITAWLAWFVGLLRRAVDDSEQRIERVLYKARFWSAASRSPMNERQRKVLTRFLGDFKGPMTSSKYAKLAGCSVDTAWRDVRDLVQRGLLRKNPSGGRSTSYRLPTSDELDA